MIARDRAPLPDLCAHQWANHTCAVPAFHHDEHVCHCGARPGQKYEPRPDLAELAEAVMLVGAFTGFDESGDEPADFAWRDAVAEADGWADRVRAKFPQLHTDEQMDAASERLERRVALPEDRIKCEFRYRGGTQCGLAERMPAHHPEEHGKDAPVWATHTFVPPARDA